MKSRPFLRARPGLSLREKYAAAQADLAKWSMLAAARLSPEANVFTRKVARGYAAEVDFYEQALMKRAGNQLPKELATKLAQISKMAALRRDREPLDLERPEQSTSTTIASERFPTFAAMLKSGAGSSQ